MVDDPANSTVVQLSRSPIAGKPYTVSEINHPFPNEYACEGFGIFAAYAALQDWDGVFFYTFEHKIPSEWTAKMPSHFEVRPDPVKMMNIAAGSMPVPARRRAAGERDDLSFLFAGAGSREHPAALLGAAVLHPRLRVAMTLVHATRIRGFDVAQPPSAGGKTTPEGGSGSQTRTDRVWGPGATFVSDTGQLAWHHGQKRQGFVTIETDRSQAVIGFVQHADKPLKNLAATVENEFCSIILTSLEDKPIARRIDCFSSPRPAPPTPA